MKDYIIYFIYNTFQMGLYLLNMGYTVFSFFKVSISLVVDGMNIIIIIIYPIISTQTIEHDYIPLLTCAIIIFFKILVSLLFVISIRYFLVVILIIPTTKIISLFSFDSSKAYLFITPSSDISSIA